jgi:hypothetical protein
MLTATEDNKRSDATKMAGVWREELIDSQYDTLKTRSLFSCNSKFQYSVSNRYYSEQVESSS